MAFWATFRFLLTKSPRPTSALAMPAGDWSSNLVPKNGGYGMDVAGFLAKVALSQRPAFSHDIGINEPTKPFVRHSDDKEREGEQHGQNS